MGKKGIAAVCSIVLLLAIFFQLNRMNLWIKFFSVTNQNALNSFSISVQPEDLAKAGHDRFLVLYDADSVFDTFGQAKVCEYLTKIKKFSEAKKYYEDVDFAKYNAIYLAVRDINVLDGEKQKQLTYFVNNGGSLIISGGMEGRNSLMEMAGVASGAGKLNVNGLVVGAGGFIGADKAVFKANVPVEWCANYTLTPDCRVLVKTIEGVPFIWERPYGKGKVICYNGEAAELKEYRGLLNLALSRTRDDYIYPVIGKKVTFIDDFPSPVPDGDLPSIRQEFNMTVKEFYSKIWWPDMIKFAKEYGIYYTGLIIESYNDKVDGEFVHDTGQETLQFLVYYGRELIKTGGELGLHGYNHMSLAPEGYNQDDLGYKVWKSQADMEKALTEVKRYINNMYPDYTLHAYVPPSNILSPEGKAAIRKVFPSVNIFCSLYNGAYEDRCFYQDFGVNKDGTCDLPRVTSGFAVSDNDYWYTQSVINAYGVVTHFIHPDQLFYEGEEDNSWKLFQKTFPEYLGKVRDNYGWIEGATASVGAQAVQNYYNLDFTQSYLENGDLELKLVNSGYGAGLILRTSKKIAKVEGAEYKDLQNGAYLLQTKQDRCVVSFEK